MAKEIVGGATSAGGRRRYWKKEEKRRIVVESLEEGASAAEVARRYLLQLNAILNGAILPSDTWFASPPPAAVTQTIARSVDPSILRGVLRAIEQQEEVDILYQSLTNTRRRSIAPHSIAFDGHRWHARAWCTEREEFRDFVLTRMLSLDRGAPSKANPSDDIEWLTLVELNIVAHPALSAPQKSAIEHDFGMKDGVLRLKTRLALAFYPIARLNLDLTDASIRPERKQICLTNMAELEAARDAAKAHSKLRVANRKTSDGGG
ncbi:MAG: WYL domain-containing protein [Roseiarcus sp.]